MTQELLQAIQENMKNIVRKSVEIEALGVTYNFVSKLEFDQKGRMLGQVADILNEREVVINLGSNYEIQVGMRFAILDELVYEVKDPDTGEILGKLPP